MIGSKRLNISIRLRINVVISISAIIVGLGLEAKADNFLIIHFKSNLISILISFALLFHPFPIFFSGRGCVQEHWPNYVLILLPKLIIGIAKKNKSINLKTKT
jgi:hypothetical protein